MNTTALSEPVLSTLPPREASSRAAHVGDLLHRVFGQTRRDARSLRGGLIWLACAMFIQLAASQAALNSPWQMLAWIAGFSAELLAPFLVACCVLNDAPASTRAFAHTLPLGRGALWLAKLALFGFCIALPLAIGDLAGHSGYAYGVREWAWAMGGSLLLLSNLLFLPASVAALAESRSRAAVYVGLGLVAALLIQGVGDHVLTEWIGWSTSSDHSLRHCQQIIGWVLSALLSFASWSVMTLLHRRRLALVLLIAAGVQPLLVERLWTLDWHIGEMKALAVGAAPLSLKVAKNKDRLPTTEPNAQTLWPELEVHGLPLNAQATVIALDREMRWQDPKGTAHVNFPTLYTDFERDGTSFMRYRNGRHRVGVQIEQSRAVAMQHPSHLLWSDQSNDAQRLSMKDLLHRTIGDRAKAETEHPWHLLLQIQTMRQVADLPLIDFLKKPTTFPLVPGIRLDVTPPSALPDRLVATVDVGATLHRDWPSLAPDPMRILRDKADRNPLWSCYIVCRDTVKNECVIYPVQMKVDLDSQWTHDPGAAALSSIYLVVPSVRLDITGQSIQSWFSQTRIEIWVPQDLGLAQMNVKEAVLEEVRESN